MSDDAMALQQEVQKLQALSGQLQQIMQQRAQFEGMLAENERAVKALDKLADDATVYRNVGSLLLQDSKADAKSRLSDESETLTIRVKRAKDQEASMKEQLDALQDKLQKAFAAQQ